MADDSLVALESQLRELRDLVRSHPGEAWTNELATISHLAAKIREHKAMMPI